ncbi:hypothetical protein ACFQS7_29460 [Dankookia sp. GCM10030260]|uniref:hypothetical protein n=1 Tax=Dankookia sp. GCM10030260 TaxID=3273390 RepID=UPI00360F7A36
MCIACLAVLQESSEAFTETKKNPTYRTSQIERRGFLLAAMSFSFLGTKANAQIPGANRINLPDTPDDGPEIPEFVTQFPGMLGGFLGLATMFQGTPVIFYDPGWISRVGGPSSPGFRFMRAHEYAHHRLSHAMRSIMALNQGNFLFGYTQEVEADCWAAETLALQGDGAAVRAGANLYANVLPPFDTQGRPGGQVRLETISRCAR